MANPAARILAGTHRIAQDTSALTGQTFFLHRGDGLSEGSRAKTNQARSESDYDGQYADQKEEGYETVDPNEILKHGGEILKQVPDFAKGAAAVIGAFKFTEITKTMLGPAANEVAECIHDEARLYRFGRQLDQLKKAEKMATDAGFTPKAVPIKVLFPLLEGASLEETEDLHTLWAALLANAASPQSPEKVRPGFIATLKHMAPDEAAMLKWMLDKHPTILMEAVPYVRLEMGYGTLFGKEHSISDHRPQICVSSLRAMGLIELTPESSVDLGYVFTWYGYDFVKACQTTRAKAWVVGQDGFWQICLGYPRACLDRSPRHVRACRD